MRKRERVETYAREETDQALTAIKLNDYRAVFDLASEIFSTVEFTPSAIYPLARMCRSPTVVTVSLCAHGKIERV